jgi:hypothetical protein
MTGSNRLVLVALDAMEVSWLERLAARGDLPNLAAFLRESGGMAVRSDGATLNGSVWPTFASGTGPGVHGRYWWLQWLAEEMRLVRASHPAFAFRPFWADLAEAGSRIVVLDVPYTSLVRHQLVEQFNGWGTIEELERESWPASFADRITKRFGKHPLSVDTVEAQKPSDLVRMANSLHVGVRMRAKLLVHFLRSGAHDSCIVVFGETHKAGHYLAEERELYPGVSNLDLIARVLKPLDEAWPEILASAGRESTIVLFALHGMRPQVDFSVLGNQALALTLGKRLEVSIPRDDLLRRIRDLVPDSAHRFVWQRLPARVRAARQAALELAQAAPGSDPVFRVAHDGHLAVRLSLKGRERDGHVDIESGTEWLERLESVAREVRTADGVPVFAGLDDLPGRFSGPRVHRLPDALLLSNPELVRVEEAFDAAGRRLVNPMQERRNGVHTGRGFCFVRPGAGVGLDGRAEIDARDFAPTAYAVLGVPAPAGFEGRPFAGRRGDG